jgi:hypothetical protein
VISQMGWGDLARPCTRLGRAQLWRRRWSRRRAINRSVALQRGQWSVWSCARGRCFSSPPVKTKRRGLQDGGQASRQEKAGQVWE